MTTSEERIAELLRALPQPPAGGSRPRRSCRARAPRARDDRRADRARRALPRARRRRPRGDAPRRRRRADTRRRRPPAPPPRAVSARHDRADAREPADGRRAPRRARRGRRRARRAAPRRRSRRRWPPALVRLVARVSHDWEEAPGIAAQAAALGDRALLLADDDHRAYAHARRAAPRAATATRRSARRCAGRRRCRSQIAEAAADVAALAALAARDGAGPCARDAWAAATLAEARQRGRGAARPREPRDATRRRALHPGRARRAAPRPRRARSRSPAA